MLMKTSVNFLVLSFNACRVQTAAGAWRVFEGRQV